MQKIAFVFILTVIFQNLVLADSSDVKQEVFIMEIKDQIDARTKRYVDLALQEATTEMPLISLLK